MFKDVRFRRLFELVVEKSCTVSFISALGWEDGGAAWRWRRRLWVLEEDMLRECVTLLRSVTLQFNFTDSWRWQLDPSASYTVRSAYQLLTTQDTA